MVIPSCLALVGRKEVRLAILAKTSGRKLLILYFPGYRRRLQKDEEQAKKGEHVKSLKDKE